MNIALSPAFVAARLDIQKTTFLVVDDFNTMRRIVVSLVRELGAKAVLEAEDGASAWDKIEAGQVDFILSDWNMPGFNGLELLKRVRMDPRTAHLPFLLLTAEATKDNILTAVQYGADGYIVKPFTPTVLSEKISQILRRKKQK